MQCDTDDDGTAEGYYYHTDDLYNVMAVTDTTGSVFEGYEYADYGQPIDPTTLAPIVGDPSAIGNPYLFTGRRYDPETAWYFYRTRYLDPIAGRFTTRDSFSVWHDSHNHGNGYNYVGGNPLSRYDPLGYKSFDYKIHIREYHLIDWDFWGNDTVADFKYRSEWSCTVERGLVLESESYRVYGVKLQGAIVSAMGGEERKGKYRSTIRYLGSGSWEEWSLWGAVGGGLTGMIAGAGTGAAIGGKIGGATGTAVAPGIGTVAGLAKGAIVGGVIGGVAGAITGALATTTDVTATLDLKYDVRCCRAPNDATIDFSTIWKNVNDSKGQLFWEKGLSYR